MITEVHQEGRFYRLRTGRAAHYENIKPHNPSTEDWCIPADMEEGDYLMMDPACEVNEKGIREKNDGNEVIEEGTSTPLDLDPNEVIEADDETLPYAEDWQDPEQIENPKNLEPDLPFTIQTRQKDGKRPRKKHNPYGDDFVVDRIDLKKIVEEVVGLEEITESQDIDIVDDHDDEWVDGWSKPEVEFDDEQQQSYEQDLKNLRVLEWLNETTSDPEETSPSTQDWCIPADMEEGDYLMMDPACEVNEKGTREKKDGNEVVEEGTDTPLDLDPNEVIEADDETLPYAEEDWQDPEQIENPKNLEPDLPFTMQTRQNDGTRPRKKYNPYGDAFVVDRIDLKKIVEEVVGLEEITVSHDIDIVDDHDDEWVDDRSKPEVEFDDEQQQSYEQDLTNLRVLEWLIEMTSDPEETSVTIQNVDRESMKYIKIERDDPSWAAQEGQPLIPASNLDLIPSMRSTGSSMDIFVRGVGLGLTHTENLINKN